MHEFCLDEHNFGVLMIHTMHDMVAVRISFPSVPGDGGSQFEAKLNKSHHVHWYCERHTDYWFTLWLDLKQILFLDCLVDNMR